MKVSTLMMSVLPFVMLAASSCATLKTAATEQEEMVTQIQKEEATNPVPVQEGRWTDANGWDYEAMGDTE